MWGMNYGGIGRYTKEIVENLLRTQDWYFTLLCSSASYNDLKEYSEYNRITLIVMTASIFTMKEQWQLFRKIPRCDIFWSPYMNVPFMPCRAQKRVVTLHDVFHIANPQYYNLVKRWVIYPYYWFSVRKSDIILTVSDFSKNEIYRYLGRIVHGEIIRVYNGCEINETLSITTSTRVEGDKYLLFVGNIKPHKNVRNALLAFREVKEWNLKLIIVGKKDGFITGDQIVFELIHEINRYGERVIFTGNIDDNELYAYYRNAFALIMPSFYEGFGIPIIEAMFFKIPILCSDIPVFREIGKEYVFYFDPNSVENIKKVIVEILERNNSGDLCLNYPKWETWWEVSEEIASLFESNQGKCYDNKK